MSDKKTCNGCKRNIGNSQFYSISSPLFADGKMPFCKKCLKDMMPENDLEKVYSILRQIDKPFLIDIWESAKADKNSTVGIYFKNINSLKQFRDLGWKDSIFTSAKNRSANESEEVEIHNDVTQKEESNSYDLNSITEIEDKDVGTIKITKELKSKWGSNSSSDILEMEKLYLEMMKANDISSPQHKKELQFYCKLSVLADRALDEGDFAGYEKLFRQLDSLKKSAGFRAIDRLSGSEATGIRSFSQVYEEIEKNGFIEPKPIKERQDIVDRTIMYILNYQLKLLNAEQLVAPPSDTPKLLPEEVKE